MDGGLVNESVTSKTITASKELKMKKKQTNLFYAIKQVLILTFKNVVTTRTHTYASLSAR